MYSALPKRGCWMFCLSQPQTTFCLWTVVDQFDQQDFGRSPIQSLQTNDMVFNNICFKVLGGFAECGR